MQLDFFHEHEDLVTDENGKVCSKCNEYLPLSAFSPCSGGNYLRAECRSCNTKMSAIRKKLKQEYGVPKKGYVCPICNLGEEKVLRSGTATSNTPWVIDHCHDTETFRGWLCHKCNRALGGFDDNLQTLNRAKEYVENHLRKIFLN